VTDKERQAMTIMTDEELAATCIWDEARGEPIDGKAGVARVILNRMTLKYSSDGTVQGTVLRKFQFSGFWFAMENGKYEQNVFNFEEALEEAQKLYTQALDSDQWNDCLSSWNAVTSRTYSGSSYNLLTNDTVLYYNPEVSEPPAWANQSKFVARIGHHEFFRG
jgi:spore germination cell wall hydrolase CwlJ-like protein